MAQESRFWDSLAERYHRQPIADETAYAEKLAVTQSFMTPEFELFEFGCGTGGTAVLHAPHVAHIDAIDFSAAMLDIARERARRAGVENITFTQGDITTFEAPAGRYDMVLGLSVLHVLEDPRAAIAKAYDLLKPGGLFVSNTACLADIMGFMKVFAPLGRAIGKLPLLSFMTSDDLVAMIEDEGFEIVHHSHPERRKALFLIGRKRA